MLGGLCVVYWYCSHMPHRPEDLCMPAEWPPFYQTRIILPSSISHPSSLCVTCGRSLTPECEQAIPPRCLLSFWRYVCDNSTSYAPLV